MAWLLDLCGPRTTAVLRAFGDTLLMLTNYLDCAMSICTVHTSLALIWQR